MPDPPAAIGEEYLPALAAPLEGRLVPSPYNFEFTGEDALRIMVHNSQAGVVVAVHFRVKTRKQTILANRAFVVPSADRVHNETEVPIGEGYLLNVVAVAEAGAPRWGQTLVKVDVIRGRGAAATVLGTIVQDCVTEMQPVAWPGSPLRSVYDSGGYYRLIQGTDPAAGSQVLETAPTGARWQLEFVRLRLVTDATVALRRVRLVLQDAGNTILNIPSPGTIPENENREAFFCAGFWQDNSYDDDILITGLPNTPILLAGGTISTSTSNMQAGDNYAAPQYAVREYLEAN